MENLGCQFWLAGGVFLCCLTTPSLSQAQITSDGKLSTQVTTSDNLNFTISGNSRAGGNLFHSFREFSVPNGGSAFFDSASDVHNIISRVTGGSISNIDGLIKANGSANLFLLNPNGIIFGPNAELGIGGSFIASTANQINFADGNFFNATDPQAQPLLTVSVPIGLQLRERSGNIINQSRVEDSSGSTVGLQVQPGKTLALVGGNVFIEGGQLSAPGGRIELGSVAGNSLVSLNPIAAGWALGYEGVQNFQDIQLSQDARVQTEGESSGDIQLRGRQIFITSRSGVSAFNNGATLGGNIALKASESVELSDNSGLGTSSFSTGAAGDITIETRQLIVRDNSLISTTSQRGNGRGGNLTVNASEFVEVDGGGGLSQLTTTSFASGNAGDLRVITGRLILRDGGQITSSTSSSGDGGTVFVDASESVEVSGTGMLFGRVFSSGLFATTSGDEATGNGGVLSINTGRLVVEDGGSISVAAVEGSTGQAGTLEINASESVEVSGASSSLLAESESPKPAGNLTISTDKLIIRDGAEVSVSCTGQGAAGNLQVTARSIRLDNQGALTAKTKAGEGNITLQAQDILLRRNSEITTDATEAASGGNITLEGLDTLAVINSQISASTEDGTAGSVRVNASESVQLSGEGGLTVEATGSGSAGSLTVDTSQLTLQEGASISASSSPSGQAGNVDITANSLRLNRGSIIAETGVGQGEEGANITLKVSDLLIMGNESLISAEAFDTANGGNIDIDARFVVAIPAEDSDIIASADRGDGGNINIKTQEIFGLEERRATPGNGTNDIDASSEFGFPGIVEITSPNVDPTKELVELPEAPVNVARLIDQNLCSAGQGSEFTVTSRGGLPESPNQALKPDAAWEDWRIEESSEQAVRTQQSVPGQMPASTHRQTTNESGQKKIVEFQGWAINARGNVVLTAEANAVTPKGVLLPPPGCQHLTKN